MAMSYIFELPLDDAQGLFDKEELKKIVTEAKRRWPKVKIERQANNIVLKFPFKLTEADIILNGLGTDFMETKE